VYADKIFVRYVDDGIERWLLPHQVKSPTARGDMTASCEVESPTASAPLVPDDVDDMTASCEVESPTASAPLVPDDVDDMTASCTDVANTSTVQDVLSVDCLPIGSGSIPLPVVLFSEGTCEFVTYFEILQGVWNY